MTSLTDTLWDLVDEAATNSNCLKKQVGAAIIRNKDHKVLATGYNHHNAACDCLGDKKGTSKHAEIMALENLTKTQKARNKSLNIVVGHKPCVPCLLALANMTYIYYKDQNNNNSKHCLKKCSKCNKHLDISKFSVRLTGRYKGHSLSMCKKCSVANCNEFDRTFSGCISNIYSTQIQSSKKRGHTLPTYSLTQLSSRLVNDFVFQLIYTNWVNLNFNTDMKPSLDRLNSNKPYTLNNLKIGTWLENKKNFEQEVFDGKHLKSGRSGLKVVRQLTLGNVEVAVFNSLAIAERATSIQAESIGNCCRHAQAKGKNGLLYTHKTAGGFKWEFI